MRRVLRLRVAEASYSWEHECQRVSGQWDGRAQSFRSFHGSIRTRRHGRNRWSRGDGVVAARLRGNERLPARVLFEYRTDPFQ